MYAQSNQSNALKTCLLESFIKNKKSIAIQDDQNSFTYEELYAAILDWIDVIKKEGILKGDRVLIVSEKSCEMLSVMLACLMSGICYVPIELPMPEKRIEAIAIDTKATAIVRISPNFKNINILSRENFSDPTEVLIFYTSGSTGNPKGILINEANILTFTQWARTQFSITASDRICAFAPWHFDLSILDLYATLLSGGSIHCPPKALKVFPYQLTQWLQQQQISIIYLVPTAVRHLVRHGLWSCTLHSALRCLLFAGEPYPISELQELRAAFPDCIIANLYGPTETNVCTWQEIPNYNILSQWHEVPIGKALPNFHLSILDEENHCVTDGTAGELVCAGLGVSPGYINDSNSSKFFNYKGEWAYRTGDLVRKVQDVYFLLGRKDRQIKLYGHRIDLHEIEAHLRRHALVKDAAVCLDNNQLIAFVAMDLPCPTEEMAKFCFQYLPNYCCPKKFIFLTKLPLTPTEKIDYKNLIEEHVYEIT